MAHFNVLELNVYKLTSEMHNQMSHVDDRMAELCSIIKRALPADGICQVTPNLEFFRLSKPAGPIHGVAKPSFCVIAQGSKVVLLGDSAYRYDPQNYLLASMELPVIGDIVDASPAMPYLALRFVFDPMMVAQVMLDSGISMTSSTSTVVSGMDVSRMDTRLMDVTVRLARLAAAPAVEVAVMLPLLTKELIFVLLMGAQGERLRQIGMHGGVAARIAGAVSVLHKRFSETLPVPELARGAGMSISGFHSHFKAVTGLSPLQFQKRIRLLSARRMLFAGDIDVTGAGIKVGYEDASQFSQEYKRMFGKSPSKDLEARRAG